MEISGGFCGYRQSKPRVSASHLWLYNYANYGMLSTTECSMVDFEKSKPRPTGVELVLSVETTLGYPFLAKTKQAVNLLFINLFLIRCGDENTTGSLLECAGVFFIADRIVLV